MNIKWIARPILAGLSLTYYVLTLWYTGEHSMFLASLVTGAFIWFFKSREIEKANARKLQSKAD